MSAAAAATPEQAARARIDALLAAAGWAVQDRADFDRQAAEGVAVREFPLPGGPSLAEMRVICDEVDGRLSEARSVAQEVANRARSVHALRQSILKAAFSGHLVPQDLNDEPASVLLARLAAQSAAAPTAPKRRGHQEPA